MKRWLAIFTVLAGLAVASAASADQRGLNLSWNDCASFGTADMTFTCDANTGLGFTMVASFLAPDSVTACVAVETQIDLIFGTSTVPSWWQLKTQTGQPAACRNNLINGDGNFTTIFNCQTTWAAPGSGGLGSYTIDPMNVGMTNRVRIVGVVAVAVADSAALTPGTEYYAMKYTISKSKTVGTCNGGCTDPVCAVLNRIAVDQPGTYPAGSPKIYDPPAGGRRTVTWQGGAGVNCNLVPTRPTTWGQIKTLYR
jgi:hypothetical protein